MRMRSPAGTMKVTTCSVPSYAVKIVSLKRLKVGDRYSVIAKFRKK